LQRKVAEPPLWPRSQDAAPAWGASAGRSATGSVAPEIHGAPASLGTARIVWRKPDPGGSQGEAVRALAATQAPARDIQIKGEAAAETASGGIVMPVLVPPSGSYDYEITRIAEKVSRVIARQLRVERERRGRTK
jgi:hypothetical protein